MKADDPTEVGSIWTWCAIDADTKLVPTFKIGQRKQYVTVLHIPPAVSPLLAVRTAIMQEYLNAKPAQA